MNIGHILLSRGLVTREQIKLAVRHLNGQRLDRRSGRDGVCPGRGHAARPSPMNWECAMSI